MVPAATIQLSHCSAEAATDNTYIWDENVSMNYLVKEAAYKTSILIKWSNRLLGAYYTSATVLNDLCGLPCLIFRTTLQYKGNDLQFTDGETEI